MTLASEEKSLSEQRLGERLRLLGFGFRGLGV